MKKFLCVLAIAAFVTACNDTTTESGTSADSSLPATTDSATMTAPVDTTSTLPADTTKVDTSKTK